MPEKEEKILTPVMLMQAMGNACHLVAVIGGVKLWMLCTLAMYKDRLYYWYAEFWISLDYVDSAACHLRMKQHYKWYFCSSCNEINAFWKYNL